MSDHQKQWGSGKKNLIAFIIFLTLLLLCRIIFYCEALRRIQGPAFLVIWLITTAFLVGVHWAVFGSKTSKIDLCTLIQQSSVTASPLMITQSHYLKAFFLIKLYLLDALQVKHSEKNDTANEKNTNYKNTIIEIDKPKSETILKQQNIRFSYSSPSSQYKENLPQGPVSILDFFTWGTAYIPPDVYRKTSGMEEIKKCEENLVDRFTLFLSAIFGLMYGILLAKLTLAWTYHKNADFLYILLILAIPVFFFIRRKYKTKVHNELETRWINHTSDNAKRKFLKLANERNLTEVIITDLSMQQRKELLQLYPLSPNGFQSLFKKSNCPENEEFLLLINACTACIQAEQKRIYAARMAAASSSNSSCSSCGGCSSCSSCSSCGGCGGCGGCGD